PADDPYGEPAPNLSSESLLGDISADDKAAPAGDKDAPADAPAAPEKQPPKDYEFKDNVFTVTLPDDTKKATKIKVPEELKDKVTLILGGVTPASVDEHGAKCIHIKMGEITQWVVYEHKEDKFSVVGSDKLKSADGKAYEVSPLEDGNFEIKKVTAEAAPEALDFTSKLDISKLQELLKTVKVEASPEDIKKAFLYYYKLDGSIKGDASQKTKEILNGTKALLTTQSLNKEQLSYLGSVDGTRYSLKKVEKQTPKWHQKKADALAKLLELNSAGRVLFIPEDKAPGEETKALIADYIAKVATATPEALNQAKALINDNQSVFLDAQGIFNIALAVERARDVKARILGDPNVELDTTDIIRIELGAKVKTLADRKSGLLLTENGKPVASFRDPNVKERVPKKKPYREGGYREGFKWVQEKKDGPYYFVKEIGGKAFNGRKFNSVGSFSEGLAYVQEKADGKWSFIDRSGKKAFGGKEFDDVWEFRKGFAPVQIGDKWYYLRRSGDKAFPNAFSEYRDQDGEHQLKSGTKWYHVTAAGTLEEAPLTAAAAEQAAAEQAATAKAAAAKAVLEKARETKAQPSYELDNGITLYTFSDNLSDGDYNPAELNSALSKIQAVTSKLSVEDQTLLKGTLKIYLLAEIKASWIERQGLAFETNQINIKYWAKAGELEEVIKGAIKLYKDQKEQEER
ncbi:MAG: WG repeat-containing protein, partial [Candidatus Peregrinibacteria bacterium]|nr:WG repeat-containing protein [Candidatus Peregrinibacteria bacterium]